MNCLEFKRLALSDPRSTEVSFIEHSEHCPECLQYVSEIRAMDNDLASSLDVTLPPDFSARLHLTQELGNDQESGAKLRGYAIAASVAIALFAGGFLFSNQLFGPKDLASDYQQLLSAVLEHMDEKPITPVMQVAEANLEAQTLLASYDHEIKLRDMENLQFARICPMGNYRGLHATLDSADGPITFAYIKGEPVGEVSSATYQGFMTRVKPVRGGNVMIISKSQRALEQADQQLAEAIYWDI